MAIERTPILGNDAVTAPDEKDFAALVEQLRPDLVKLAERRFPRSVDDHVIADGVDDAMLEYRDRPAEFEPARGMSLDNFLAFAVARNVVNSRWAEHRRRAVEGKCRKKEDYSVELDGSAGITIIEDEEAKRCLYDWLLAVLANSIDRQVFQLMYQGVRDTPAHVEVMGIGELSTLQQRKSVKQSKDRIVKRLQRHAPAIARFVER